MDEVQEQQQMMSAPGPAPQADPQVQTPVPPSSVVVKMPPQLESRLNNLEKQVFYCTVTIKSSGNCVLGIFFSSPD